MQDPNILLTILSRMAQKPEVKFDKLFQKLYNTNLWQMESGKGKPESRIRLTVYVRFGGKFSET